MTKQQRNNRANQLNPNNKAYYKSRMAAHSGSGKKVVHHHHHHHNSKGAGTRCPVCGSNHLKVTLSGVYNYYIECKACGAEFSKRRQ